MSKPKPSTENPYRSPESTSANGPVHGALKRDVFVILLAFVLTFVLAPILATLCLYLVFGNSVLFLDPAAITWVRLLVIVAADLMPNLLSGYVLGRYLVRVDAWHVLCLIGVLMVGVLGLAYVLGRIPGSVLAPQPSPSLLIVQGIMETLMPVAIIAGGILRGQRERRKSHLARGPQTGKYGNAAD